MQASAEVSLPLKLSTAEKQILLKACKLYRAKIPNYLDSRQTEFQILEKIIQKLT